METIKENEIPENFIPKSCEWMVDNNEECKNLIYNNGIYCVEHKEDYDNWLILLKFYVQDVLKTIDHRIIKELNKDIPHFKQYIECQFNISRYKLHKYIKEQYLNGKNDIEIVKLLDEEF